MFRFEDHHSERADDADEGQRQSVEKSLSLKGGLIFSFQSVLPLTG